MARLRVAVSLAKVPRMLRSIISETLERSPLVDVVPLDDASSSDRLDALVTSDHQGPDIARQAGRVRQLIAIDLDGSAATVYRQDGSPRRIDDLSRRGSSTCWARGRR